MREENMRRLLIGVLAFGAAFAASAQGEGIYAQTTGTVQPAGPRAAPNGDNFFNIENSTNGANASYGAVRWNISTLKTTLDNTYGPNNWAIDAVDLNLWQDNSAFSRSGNVKVYFSTDDTTDIKTRTPAPFVTYPFEQPGP